MTNFQIKNATTKKAPTSKLGSGQLVV